MGKSERRKGHDYERRIVRWLKAFIPRVDPERVLDETREGNNGDVRGGLRSWSPGGNGTSSEVVPLLIQAKFRKAPSPWKAQTEADEAASSPSDIAVSFCRRKRDQTLVTMRPDTFGTLLYLAAEALATTGPGRYTDVRNMIADLEEEGP